MSATPGIVTLQVERASWQEDTFNFYPDELGENALLTLRLSLNDTSVASNFICDLSWREYGSVDVLGTKRICVGSPVTRRSKSMGQIDYYGYNDLFAGITQDKWMLYSKVFYAETAYEFTCTYSDGNETATATFLLEEVPANMHLSGTGKGVAIGKFSGSTVGNPLFECAYPAVFSENVVFSKNVAVPVTGLLQVFNFRVLNGVNIASQGVSSGTHNITMAEVPEGWTPIAIAGYNTDTRYASVYDLRVAVSDRSVLYGVYNVRTSYSITVSMRVYVLCVRTGL